MTISGASVKQWRFFRSVSGPDLQNYIAGLLNGGLGGLGLGDLAKLFG